MIWLKSIDIQEYIFIGCFSALYILFILRIWWIARKLRSSIPSVFIKFILRSVYFSFLIIALLGPSFGDVKKEIKAVSKDILLVMDLSKSMDAFDVQPSRLERAKHSMQLLVKRFHSDRIGLIIFSSSAFLQCPLTYDHDAVLLFMETLNTELLINQGTDFTPALSLAAETFEQGQSQKEDSRVMVLVTDGEDFGAIPSELTDEYNDATINSFVLATGTEAGSKIPRKGGGFKKDKNEDIILTQMNLGELYKLTNDLNGRLFELNDDIDETENLINTIDEVEGELRDTRKVNAAANKYFYFLLIALFLIIMDILLTLNTFRK